MDTHILLPKVVANLRQHGIKYETFACDPGLADTAAFCEEYGFSLAESANAILVTSKKIEPTKYALCVVLATTRLDVNKKVCQLLGVKRVSFASAEETQAKTGMMIGGVTAIGVEDMPIYVDAAVMEQPRVVMGGGNRSSKIVLAPAELLKLPGVQVVSELAKRKE